MIFNEKSVIQLIKFILIQKQTRPITTSVIISNLSVYYLIALLRFYKIKFYNITFNYVF